VIIGSTLPDLVGKKRVKQANLPNLVGRQSVFMAVFLLCVEEFYTPSLWGGVLFFMEMFYDGDIL